MKFSRENIKKDVNKAVSHFIMRVVCQIFVTIVLALVYVCTIYYDLKHGPQLYTKTERLLWTIYYVIGYAFLTWYIWCVEFTINGVIG